MKIAIPSKGRIMEMTKGFLSDCGLTLQTDLGTRSYTGRILELEGIKIHFNRPDEIPEMIDSNEVDAGFTGEDLMAECLGGRIPDYIRSVPLGYGKADLVVAVPDSWEDVDCMDDLEDIAIEIRNRKNRGLKVATSFPRLTGRFLNESHIQDFRIILSGGATESLPNKGLADIITDITSTGSTIRQNGLKIISDGKIVESEVCLFLNTRSNWYDENLQRLKKLLRRIDAYKRSKKVCFIQINFSHTENRKDIYDSCELFKVEVFSDRQSPETEDFKNFAVDLICNKSEAVSFIDHLSNKFEFSYVIKDLSIYGSSSVPAYDQFLTHLRKV